MEGKELHELLDILEKEFGFIIRTQPKRRRRKSSAKMQNFGIYLEIYLGDIMPSENLQFTEEELRNRLQKCKNTLEAELSQEIINLKKKLRELKRSDLF